MRKISTILLTVLLGLSVGCSKNDIKNGGLSGLHVNGSSFASAPGDVVGKVVVGYQGWFSALGDGSPANNWAHQNLEMWPDQREYTTLYSGSPFDQNGVQEPPFTGNLGNGTAAKMFSAYDQSTVNLHFLWMQQSGAADCVALQRFGSELDNTTLKAQRDGMANKVQTAAQTYGKKFFIMYDISGWTNFQTEIKTDWTNDMHAHTTSSAYAMQNGKPVVCIWGFGFSGRPGNVTSWSDVINWFKGQGCYVIGGVPTNFQSDATNTPAYSLCNMLMPWRVGVTSNFQTDDTNELAYCNAHGIDYQTDVYPGTAFYNTNGGTKSPKNQIPRTHGDFMWSQYAAAKNAGVQSIYISMFDEMNEATSIFKVAEDASMIPAGNYFQTLDADGVHTSSDFYLRLASDGSKMIKGTIPFVATEPTAYVYLDNCNATTGWISANTLSLNTSDKKEGTGSLQSVGSGTDEFKKVFTAFNTGATAANGSIDFWYYVSDITKFSSSNQIELGSGGGPDVNEYNWNIGTLVNGWNHIVKTFATAGTTGGTPNLAAINWFRIYHAKTASITTKVDAIQIPH